MGHLRAEDGGISHNGIWKVKTAFDSKDKNYIPVALKDKKGNRITSPQLIGNLCLEEVLERARNRVIHPDLSDLKALKEAHYKKRIDIVKNI